MTDMSPPRSRGAPKQDTAWTATRCHRLLRPLQSHIAALRKEKARRLALSHGVDSSAGTTGTTGTKRPVSEVESCTSNPRKRICYRSARRTARNASRNQDSSPQRDYDDIAPVQRSGRVGDNRPTSTQEVAMPTPFMRRVRDHLLSSPQQPMALDVERSPSLRQQRLVASSTNSGRSCCHSSFCHGNKNNKPRSCSFETELAGLRSRERSRSTTSGAETHALYESLFRSLDSLLKATQLSNQAAAGPRSLLGMALRKVPEYVAELEYWEQKDAEESGTKSMIQNDSEASFQIYSELEELGVGAGWKHLSSVVRAHGLNLCRQAVSEGLLSEVVIDLLIKLCLEYMPVMECMGLLDEFILRRYPGPSDNFEGDHLFDAPGLRPLRTLRHCDPSRASLLPTKLASLLRTGHLPAEWLLTSEFNTQLVSAARLLARKGRYCKGAIDLITTSITLLCEIISPKMQKGKPRADTRLSSTSSSKKANKILVGVLAALTAMVLLCQEETGTLENQKGRSAVLQERVESIIHSCSNSLQLLQKNSKSTLHGLQTGRYLLSFCAFLCSFTTTNDFKATWEAMQSGKGSKDNTAWERQYDSVLALLSSVAHRCSRGSRLSTRPHVHLVRLCERIEEALHSYGDDDMQPPASSIRVDGAFYLAEQTGDLRDLAFAESLQVKAKSSGISSNVRGGLKDSSNAKTTAAAAATTTISFAGFHWDDGLGEWVAKEPSSPPLGAAILVATTTSRRRTRSTRAQRPAYLPLKDEEEVDSDHEADDNDSDKVVDVEIGETDDDEFGGSETSPAEDDEPQASSGDDDNRADGGSTDDGSSDDEEEEEEEEEEKVEGGHQNASRTITPGRGSSQTSTARKSSLARPSSQASSSSRGIVQKQLIERDDDELSYYEDDDVNSSAVDDKENVLVVTKSHHSRLLVRQQPKQLPASRETKSSSSSGVVGATRGRRSSLMSAQGTVVGGRKSMSKAALRRSLGGRADGGESSDDELC